MIEEEHGIDVHHVLNNCVTLKDVDHCLTAKIFGYDSADHYYSSVGCRKVLKDIKMPTLFIQASDDPVCGVESIPTDSEILDNKNVVLMVTNGGGHIGYFESIFS